MRKRLELTDSTSCLSRAHDDEMVFVLLGRDVSAPVAIRAWCQSRIAFEKNHPDDPQLIEAMACAEEMDRERAHGAPAAGQQTASRNIWYEKAMAYKSERVALLAALQAFMRASGHGINDTELGCCALGDAVVTARAAIRQAKDQ